MVSSAMYRYFPSREDLLTALVADAYDAAGRAVEAAESAVPRRSLLGRWLAVAGALRAWALAQPQQYALIFGGPVPDYQPPAGMLDPASGVWLLMVHLVSDAVTAGRGPVADGRPIPRAVRADLKSLRSSVAPVLTEAQLAHVVMAWTELVGSVSSELFGHLDHLIHDYQSYFDYQMRGVGQRLGLT